MSEEEKVAEPKSVDTYVKVTCFCPDVHRRTEWFFEGHTATAEALEKMYTMDPNNEMLFILETHTPQYTAKQEIKISARSFKAWTHDDI
jgi:hypothetical protein